MGLLRILAAGAVLLAVMNVPALSQTCQLRQAASIDIAFAQGGGVLVPVTIEGQPEQLLLQLSGAHSGLTQDAVTRLRLVLKPVPTSLSIEYMDRHVGFTTTAKDFSLGGIKGDVDAYVVPNLRGFDPAAAGVLGLDLLENFDVELDLAAKKLNLFATDHCPGKVVYWTHGPVASLPMTIEKLGNFTAPMTLDNAAIRVSFDTLRAASRIDINSAHAMFGLTETSPGVGAPQRVPGSRVIRPYTFKSLTGDGITVSNPEIVLVGDTDTSYRPCKGEEQPERLRADYLVRDRCFGGESDLDLGLDLQRQLHLFFDFSEKTLYFTAADQH